MATAAAEYMLNSRLECCRTNTIITRDERPAFKRGVHRPDVKCVVVVVGGSLCGGELILNSRSDTLRGVPSSNLCATRPTFLIPAMTCCLCRKIRGLECGLVKPTRQVELFEQLATKYFKGFEIHRHSA